MRAAGRARGHPHGGPDPARRATGSPRHHRARVAIHRSGAARRGRGPGLIVGMGLVAVLAAGCTTPVAMDFFGRTMSGTWGSALLGGTWTQVKGAPSEVSVDGNDGVFSIPAGNYLTAEQIMTLPTTSVRDSTGTFVATFDQNINTVNPHYGGVVAYLVARYQNSSATGYYRMGIVWDAATRRLWLRTQNAAGKGAPSNWTIEHNTGINPVADYPNGGPYAYNVVARISGAFPTTFESKVWKVGTAEPAGWMLTGTDPGNLGPQSAGPIGVRASNDLQTSPSTYPNFTEQIEITAVSVASP